MAEGEAEVIVAQGAEAGGHRSTFELGLEGEVSLVGTLALGVRVRRSSAPLFTGRGRGRPRLMEEAGSVLSRLRYG